MQLERQQRHRNYHVHVDDSYDNPTFLEASFDWFTDPPRTKTSTATFPQRQPGLLLFFALVDCNRFLWAHLTARHQLCIDLFTYSLCFCICVRIGSCNDGVDDDAHGYLGRTDVQTVS